MYIDENMVYTGYIHGTYYHSFQALQRILKPYPVCTRRGHYRNKCQSYLAKFAAGQQCLQDSSYTAVC